MPSQDMVACLSAELTVSLRALQQYSSVSRQGNWLRYCYLFLCPLQGLENQELGLLSESWKRTVITGSALLTNKTSPRYWKSSSWSSWQSRRSRWRSPSRSASCWRRVVQQPPPWCEVRPRDIFTSQHQGDTVNCHGRNLFLLFFLLSEKTISIASELSPTVTRGIPPLNIF